MDRHRLYLWRKTAAGIFFPLRFCAYCGKESPNAILCPTCREAQMRLRPCPTCATFLATTEPPHYRCENCRRQPPSFSLARAALPYQGQLRQRILAFKYREDTGQRRYLAPLLAETFHRWYAGLPIDMVVPIPLHPQRLEERGYNQAELLTRLLSADLNLDHAPDLLTRIKDTCRLANLSRSEREKVLQGAFRAEASAQGKTILLVDDIYTSGATASSASRALLRSGAKAVYVLSVAAGWDLGVQKKYPDNFLNEEELPV